MLALLWGVLIRVRPRMTSLKAGARNVHVLVNRLLVCFSFLFFSFDNFIVYANAVTLAPALTLAQILTPALIIQF